MSFRIALGGPTDLVHTVAFAPGNKLELLSSFESKRATWIVPHPSIKGVFFATGELDGGVVRVIKFDGDTGTVLGAVSSGGMHPTHLATSVDGSELFVANYSTGGVLVLPVLADAPYLGEPVSAASHIEFPYTPPAPHESQVHFNPDRQECSHPHQVLVLPAPHSEVLVPDLGSDKVWRLAQSPGAKEWEIVGFVEFPRGSGPRHAALYDGVLYTVLELTSELSAHIFPPLAAAPTHIATFSTLGKTSTTSADASAPLLPTEVIYADRVPSVPKSSTADEETESPPQLAAEILIPPALPEDDGTTFVYVTNRDEPDPKGDAIAVYSLHPDFQLVHRIHTGVRHLRGIAFSPGEGRYVAFAGQNGGGFKVWERKAGGTLVPVDGAALDLNDVSSVTWV
ncbi:putative isomerase YbhE [Exidia glandulosa HHB12029]|uniref:Putative isomerase YbhE n=1 Tax=Exidia glandulosa HHB12029 TaxID=1314781 RepID=A0A165LTS2_EXIGL|nr:putative isomerase YbhE [Exidia glandulosa HHB12029]